MVEKPTLKSHCSRGCDSTQRDVLDVVPLLGSGLLCGSSKCDEFGCTRSTTYSSSDNQQLVSRSRVRCNLDFRTCALQRVCSHIQQTSSRARSCDRYEGCTNCVLSSTDVTCTSSTQEKAIDGVKVARRTHGRSAVQRDCLCHWRTTQGSKHGYRLGGVRSRCRYKINRVCCARLTCELTVQTRVGKRPVVLTDFTCDSGCRSSRKCRRRQARRHSHRATVEQVENTTSAKIIEDLNICTGGNRDGFTAAGSCGHIDADFLGELTVVLTGEDH